MNLLKELTEKVQASYVLIAHDLATVRFLTDRSIVLHRGHVVEMANTEQLFTRPLADVTRRLLASSRAKSIHGLRNQRQQETVDFDDPIDRPDGGCVRCALSGETCPGSTPGLAEVEDGHFLACQRQVATPEPLPDV